jgi:hypothetical protein
MNDDTRPAFPFKAPADATESGPPHAAPDGGDWEKFLAERQAQGAPAIDLKTLRAGDRVVVETKNTRYELLWRDDGTAELSTNRPDRAPGLVAVQGCGFGRVGPVKAGVLFCGGSLEYHSLDGNLRFRTTTVKALAMIARPAQSA